MLSTLDQPTKFVQTYQHYARRDTRLEKENSSNTSALNYSPCVCASKNRSYEVSPEPELQGMLWLLPARVFCETYPEDLFKRAFIDINGS
ncbi:uncharacterized protein H6S33_011033 [Morchella sextelata]|uniref:uncharacterized protein n=1 Tax=Morchella sextelata TaxID=1174677 RepID=UPI001D04A92F|nr:uncharacterized protein H6S33_011033 [Morchella sextelata]KAH0611768.1 hypothetical protein H6S33_011033 [Morchella sextelata]